MDALAPLPPPSGHSDLAPIIFEVNLVPIRSCSGRDQTSPAAADGADMGGSPATGELLATRFRSAFHKFEISTEAGPKFSYASYFWSIIEKTRMLADL